MAGLKIARSTAKNLPPELQNIVYGYYVEPTERDTLRRALEYLMEQGPSEIIQARPYSAVVERPSHYLTINSSEEVYRITFTLKDCPDCGSQRGCFILEKEGILELDMYKRVEILCSVPQVLKYFSEVAIYNISYTGSVDHYPLYMRGSGFDLGYNVYEGRVLRHKGRGKAVYITPPKGF